MSKYETAKQESSSKRFEEVECDTISSQSKQPFDRVDAPVQTFYVCFSGCGQYLFSNWLEPGFTHVSIMEQIPLGFIVHDPNRCALDTYVLPDAPTKDFMVSFLKERPDYTVLEVRKRATNREQHLIRFGLQTCVNVVAYIMGLQLPWHCVTPYGLYKRILDGDDSILSIRRVVHEGSQRSKKSASGR